MARLHDIVRYCEQRLDVAGFDDYCPNGLQVEAGDRVRRIVSGVTASRALIEAAVARRADLLLVHHGYFWKGEAQPLVGIKGARVARLFRNGLSLLAYHLPLDAHPELGNNAQLGRRLALDGGPADAAGGLIWQAEPVEPMTAVELAGRIADSLQRPPLHIPGGPEIVRRIAWCTGAAQGFLAQAVELGCDAYVTGEVNEQTVHMARELGVHFYAAGHHATERYGVQALGEELAAAFGVEHQFVDVDNPV